MIYYPYPHFNEYEKVFLYYSNNIVFHCQKMSQAYLQVEHQYAPINIMPTNYIKCTQCDEYVPLKDFQTHSLTHINPRYINQKPSIPNNKVQKKNLRAFLEEEDDVEIWVKSVCADDLPGKDVQKKKVQELKWDEGQIKGDGMQGHEMDIAFKMSTLPDEMAEELVSDKEEEQELELSKKIDLTIHRFQICRKQPKLYKNSREEENCYDQHQEDIKLSRESQGEKLSYEVKPMEQQDRRDAITVDLNLKPKQLARKKELSTLSVANPLECPACHGFYCHYCKSTIPPQYRPVPKGIQSTAESFFRKKCEQCE